MLLNITFTALPLSLLPLLGHTLWCRISETKVIFSKNGPWFILWMKWAKVTIWNVPCHISKFQLSRRKFINRVLPGPTPWGPHKHLLEKRHISVIEWAKWSRLSPWTTNRWYWLTSELPKLFYQNPDPFLTQKHTPFVKCSKLSSNMTNLLSKMTWYIPQVCTSLI